MKPSATAVTWRRLWLAISEVWDALPELLGLAQWTAIRSDLWELLRQLESGDAHAEQRIVEFFRAHPAVEDVLGSAMARVGSVKAATARAGSEPVGRRSEVPVLFGTDRLWDGNTFGPEPNERTLAFGVVRVNIPEDHRMGKFERPPSWRLAFWRKAHKYVEVLEREKLTETAFSELACRSIAAARRRDVLIFIHGFNVTFDEAAMRAAQVAYDVRFEGQIMLYSWPSMGKVVGYPSDSDKIIQTERQLERFIDSVAMQSGAEHIHLIAHSMGSRALVHVLEKLKLKNEAGATGAKLGEIVFAAPDIAQSTFLDAAEAFAGNAARTTLYASSRDYALKVSRKYNNSLRAGDSGLHLLLGDSFDTIDASTVKTSLLGHSFYGDNKTVLADLELLIRTGLAADERSSLDRREGSRPYWIFRR